MPKGAVSFYDVTIAEVGAKEVAAPRIGQKGVVLKNPMKPAANRLVLMEVTSKFGAGDFKNTPIAYDGKSNIYTTKVLPFQDRNFEVKLVIEGREKSFNVNIKHIKEVPLSIIGDFIAGKTRETPMEALTALDVILGAIPSSKWVPRGRNFYNPQVKNNLGGGVEAWSGYF